MSPYTLPNVRFGSQTYPPTERFTLLPEVCHVLVSGNGSSVKLPHTPYLRGLRRRTVEIDTTCDDLNPNPFSSGGLTLISYP